MLYDIHTERVNIGYNGINSVQEIIKNTKNLTDTFTEFFDELDEEHYLTLCQETIPGHKTIHYYLKIEMSELLAPTFVLYFGDELKIQNAI